eukprot:g1585.t1
MEMNEDINDLSVFDTLVERDVLVKLISSILLSTPSLSELTREYRGVTWSLKRSKRAGDKTSEETEYNIFDVWRNLSCFLNDLPSLKGAFLWCQQNGMQEQNIRALRKVIWKIETSAQTQTMNERKEEENMLRQMEIDDEVEAKKNFKRGQQEEEKVFKHTLDAVMRNRELQS